MKYFATTAALVSAIPCIVSLTINTPTSVVQCQPELLSWTDGAPPYYVSILPGGEPGATPIKSFDTQTGMSLTWNVDIAAGTSVTFALKDSTGATAYTDTVPIQAGPDSSCVTGGSQAAAITPGSAGSSNSAVSANPANPSVVATQGTDASGSTVSGSTGTTRVAGAGVGATTARANASAATPAATQSRAVATAGTTSAARPSSSSTSGAESLFTGSGLGFAGIIGLAGALFL
ncbi:hypothetical protein BJ912DRAFT_655872 [Pholiota molesta]|nr:hypothetical protein BJ912DRAFT_655872 [Pholiota molesta]